MTESIVAELEQVVETTHHYESDAREFQETMDKFFEHSNDLISKVEDNKESLAELKEVLDYFHV